MGGIGCGLGSIKVTPACSGSPQSDPRGLYRSARVRGSRGRCQAPIPSRRSEAASLVLRFAVWVRARHAAGGERGEAIRASVSAQTSHFPGCTDPGARGVRRGARCPGPGRPRCRSCAPGGGFNPSRAVWRPARGVPGRVPQQAESRVGRGRRSAPPTLLRRQPPPPPRFGARGLAQAGAGARRHFQGGRSAPGPRYLYIQSGRRSPLLRASARPAPPPLRMPEGVVAPGPGPPGAASRCNPRGRSLGRGAGGPPRAKPFPNPSRRTGPRAARWQAAPRGAGAQELPTHTPPLPCTRAHKAGAATSEPPKALREAASRCGNFARRSPSLHWSRRAS